MRQDITANVATIKRMIREHCKLLHGHKVDNLRNGLIFKKNRNYQNSTKMKQFE